MRLVKPLSIIVFCLTISLSSAGAMAASPAQEQLKTSIEKIIQILKDPSLKGESQIQPRRQALRKAIDERFSFRKMSQFSLARHWKAITPEQKKEFVVLFGKLLEETYVNKIESYTNEKIEYTGERVSAKKAKIYSEIHTQEVTIPVEYRMFNAGEGNWMVYDMLIEGVSLIKNYRTQFDEIMQNGTFETLVEELKKKIDS